MESQVRILLVEDDTELRTSLAECLEMINFVVAPVGSAIECYQAVNEGVHDIAVIDVGLPDQSGFDVATYLRDKTDMGIVMLTARSALEDRMQGYEVGADLYFVKPVNCRELGAALCNLAGRLDQKNRDALPVWHLDIDGWFLVHQQKGRVKLTSKEVLFLEILFSEKGEPSVRETLMKDLGYQEDLYGSRALDMLVGRLRKKIERALGEVLPLHTVHGVGYCLKSSNIR